MPNPSGDLPLLLFLCHGPKSLYHQSAVLLASLTQVTDANWGGLEAVVYTDEPSFWAHNYPAITVHEISASLKKQWLGPHQFIHCMKVHMILDCLRRYNRPICYMDSDCIFTQDPRPSLLQINPSVSLMHELETRLDKPKGPLPQKVARFLRKSKFTIAGQPHQVFPLSTELWNAGVIGIHPSLTPAVEEALEWTNALYAGYQKHIMEQVAFSYVLTKYSEVRASDAWLDHYWYAKKTVNPILEQLFAETERPVRSIAMEAFARLPDAAKRHLAENAQRKRPFWKRWFA